MVKRLWFLTLLLGSSIEILSQNSNGRKTEEDPLLLNKIQGTWMNSTPGEHYWYKVQISGKEVRIWISSPRTGHWNDGASLNDPTLCDITGCYKITDRNEYDGRLQTESIALTRRRSGSEGYTINLHQERGIYLLRIMDSKGTIWRVLKKVSPNFSPWE